MGFLRSILLRLGLVKVCACRYYNYHISTFKWSILIFGTLATSQTKVGLLVVGLTNSGKSTVVARLTKDPIEEVAPTVGFAVESVKMDGLSVTIFDMSGACQHETDISTQSLPVDFTGVSAGNKRYHELWKLYYKETTVGCTSRVR